MPATNQESYQLYKRYIKNISLTYQKREDLRTYIELLLSLSVMALFGIFAIRPTVITIIELNKEAEGKKSIASKLETKIENLDKAQLTYNQNKGTIDLVNIAIPDGPSPETYVRQVEGLAKTNQVSLVGVGTSRVKIAGASTEAKSFPTESEDIEITLDVAGTYQDLMQFIVQFEKMRRPMFVDILNLRERGNNSNGELIVSIVGRVPYIPN